MKKISKYIYILGFGAVALTSCNMDVTPTYAVTYQDGDTLVTTKDNLEKMENGILSSYRSCQYGEFSQAEEVMCDGFNATQDYGNNYGGIHRMDDSFTAGDYYVQDFWSYNYSAIKDYNVYLAALESYSPTTTALQAEAKICKGEACFLRASSYLQLVRHFAKAYNSSSAATDLAVPIVLKYDQNAKPARNTVKEVYAQIKIDLDEAAADLASVSGKIGAQKPTIDAVNALYARYYLDIADYTNAAIYAMKVINSSAGYALSSNAAAMTAEYTNDSGTESIMQLYASLSENGSGTNDIYTKASYSTDFAAYHKGVFFTSWFLPSQKLLNTYENSDLRLSTWYSNTYVNYLASNAYRGDFYTFIKYLGNPALTSGNTPNARQHVKPFMIGEMYLIAAEAYLKGTDAGSAKTLLNTLQAARGASTTDATMPNIQNEWFKETVGEGLRLSCIKRWGEGFTARVGQTGALTDKVLMTGASYTDKSMSSSDFHLVWPIPTYEMKVNSNLVQNTGY
ncbi:MAG: RagB/SusD family nutrient uptake outer membrane protein [Bacteroidales bacterium]|nr:RagB/SusD family nutrient uptake outer membrane protein [Bacteroidales bacterium]